MTRAIRVTGRQRSAMTALIGLLTVIVPTLVMLVGPTSVGPATAVEPTAAPTLNWIQWTAPSSYPEAAKISYYDYTYATEALGTITMPGGATIYVKFTGEIVNYPGASEFGSGSTSIFWADCDGCGTDGAAFKSTNVPDLPSTSDRIAVSGSTDGGVQLQTLEFFSDPARTVPATMLNLVMDVWSLGAPDDSGAWSFTQDFEILSDNAPPVSSYSGFTKGAGGPPYEVSADEGTGTLQFTGSYSSVAWTVLNPEFYAAWNIGVTSASAPRSVTFDANGGTGGPMNRQSSAEGTAAPLTTNAFTRAGYTFTGWNTAADGTGTAYANGASYPFADSATLYAQWLADTPSTTTTIAPTTTTTIAPTTTTVAPTTTSTTPSPSRSGLPLTGAQILTLTLGGSFLVIVGFAMYAFGLVAAPAGDRRTTELVVTGGSATRTRRRPQRSQRPQLPTRPTTPTPIPAPVVTTPAPVVVPPAPVVEEIAVVEEFAVVEEIAVLEAPVVEEIAVVEELALVEAPVVDETPVVEPFAPVWVRTQDVVVAQLADDWASADRVADAARVAALRSRLRRLDGVAGAGAEAWRARIERELHSLGLTID